MTDAGRGSAARRRRGVTLVELTVALSIALVVGAAAGGVLARQHRFYAEAGEVAAGRQQVAGALAIVAADLRAASPAAGDLTAIAPDAVQLRATIGAAVACATAGDALDSPTPSGAARAAGLVAWRSAPRAGDTLAVYHPPDGTLPGRWTSHAVASFSATGGACPAGDPLGGGGTGARIVVDAATPLSPDVGAGTAVRVLRHVRYSLYVGGDGGRQLGYADYRAGAGWATVQPVAGPFAAPAGPPAFRFLDDAGAELAAPHRARTARVLLALRAESSRVPGRRTLGGAHDSAAVAVRGRDD
jgi:prepilin-type N-terminal cleavage/methylation domain-containing protein